MRTFSVAVTSLLAVTGLVAAIPAPQGPDDLTDPPSGYTLADAVNQGMAGVPAVAPQLADQLGDVSEEAANVAAGAGRSGQDLDPAASQNTASQPSQLENNDGIIGDVLKTIGGRS